MAALGALVEIKASAVVVTQPRGGGGSKGKGPNNNAKKRAKKRPAVAARQLRRGKVKKANAGGWAGYGDAGEYNFGEAAAGGGGGDW